MYNGELKAKPYPNIIYAYSLLCSLYGFASGWSAAIILPAILYIPQSIHLSLHSTSILMTIPIIGALLGAFVGGVVGDVWGRKRALLAFSLGAVSGCLINAWSKSAIEMIIGRGLVGGSAGAVGVISSLWSVECAPEALRMRLQAYGHLSGWVGGVLSILCGLLIIEGGIEEGGWSGAEAWRYVYIVGACVWAGVGFLNHFTLPESPKWLCEVEEDGREKTREQEAYLIIKSIHGHHHLGEAREQFESFRTQAQLGGEIEEVERGGNGIDDFLGGTLLSRAEIISHQTPLIVCIVLQGLHQASGNPIISTYSTLIMHSIGFEKDSSVLMTALLMIPQILIIWFVVGRVGCDDNSGGAGVVVKRAIVGSLCGILISLIVLAFTALGWTPSVQTIDGGYHDYKSTWTLLAIIINKLSYSAGLGPLTFVLMAEILPLSCRGRALAIMITIGEIMKIMTMLLFPLCVQWLGAGIVYGVMGLGVAMGIVYLVRVIEGSGAEISIVK